MQWIFMLVGLALGAMVDEALFGALFGLGMAQMFKLQGLERENVLLKNQIKVLADQLDLKIAALTRRLYKLEQDAALPAESPSIAEPACALADDPVPASAPVSTDSAPVAEPALDGSLDAALTEREPEPGAALTQAITQQAIIQQAPAEPAPVDPIHTAEFLAPTEPRQPGLFERGFALAKDWLLGGNTVLRVGVVLLFLGLAFLLRYATEGVVVPVELRYASVAASALALLALGWWLRLRNPSYALMLQGTGVAVLYLTVFSAMRLHPLLAPGMALALLVLITLFSAILAVKQDALSLAAAAALGGFAAPILTSTGGGKHVALFSYFALLNAGILAIAWFKAWRLLNLIGFVGTFGIGLAWGVRAYTPQLLWSTEPFLLLFFVMYVAIGLLFARRKLREMQDAPEQRAALLRWAVRQGDYIDATVLFGPPLVGFGLQFALVQHIEFAAAFSALGLGLFYLLLARLLVGRTCDRALLLVETCLALGVVFASLAIPLGLDARWTSAAWAVEGAGIYWLGLRQQRRLARAFALLLQFGAALAFLGGLRVGEQSLLSGVPLGALMLGAALLFSGWQLRQHRAQASTWEVRGLSLLACVGLAFIYLMAPLLFAAQGTAISWALAGLLTLWLGLRLQVRSFLFSAFAVQLLGGLVFMLEMVAQAATGMGSFVAGWQGLLTSSLIGLGLIAGVFLAARDSQIGSNRRLLHGLSAVLLVGLVFLNLAVLFVLPWATASAVWGGSGLLIIWLSLHLQQRASFVFGLLLQVLAGLVFLVVSPLLTGHLPSEGLRPLAHVDFWTPLVLGVAALIGAWQMQQWARRETSEVLGPFSLLGLARLLLVWGAAWWALALSSEVLRFVAAEWQTSALLVLLAASVALAAFLAPRTRWNDLAVLCCLLTPLAGVLLLHAWHLRYHPAAQLGWLAWTLLFTVHFWTLRRLAAQLPAGALSAAHVFGCWLLLGVLALELRYLLLALSEQYNAWRWLGWALLPSAYLWLMARSLAREQVPDGQRALETSRWRWPLAAYPREYRLLAAAPLALLMLGWFWLANLASAGDAEPLVYLPLLNPLELGLLFALGAWFAWAQLGLVEMGEGVAHSRWLSQAVAGVSLFALLTAMVMRTVHHWGGVPYQLDALLGSMLVQAGLSIVWTLIALPLMVFGNRWGRRELWLIGAALIAVVVAKLFFVELGHRGGLERIVSFIGVGVLLLIVGYFAPLPARRAGVDQLQESA